MSAATRVEPRSAARRAPAQAWPAPVTFRFGLTGLRWGETGPVVLMLHGPGGSPAQFAAWAADLLAAGRQVVALDAPPRHDSLGDDAYAAEYALAALEAAVEMPDLESVVGHSLGATAAALALAQGLRAGRAVLLAPTFTAAASSGMQRVLHHALAALGQFWRHPSPPPDMRRVLHGLNVPGLIVHDRHDDTAPFDNAGDISRAWRGSQLLLTRGLGHRRLPGDDDVRGYATAFLAGGAPHSRLGAVMTAASAGHPVH